jgi:hypothetical protein
LGFRVLGFLGFKEWNEDLQILKQWPSKLQLFEF